MAAADLKAKANKDQADLATLQEQIATLKAELKEKKKNTPKALSLKVSQKGALSVYGLGRFPVTLYPTQFQRLLSIKEDIEAFIEDNKADFSYKS
jgi:ribosome-interacting GTPase 1